MTFTKLSNDTFEISGIPSVEAARTMLSKEGRVNDDVTIFQTDSPLGNVKAKIEWREERSGLLTAKAKLVDTSYFILGLVQNKIRASVDRANKGK